MLIGLVVAATMAVQQPLEGPPVTAQFERARDQLNREMIDYGSAKFRDVHADRRRICGYVNGKNRLGAYAGWKRFVISGIPDAQLIIETNDEIEEIPLMCDGASAPPTSPDYSDRLTHR